jgi:PKD repeat protein
MTPLSFTRTRRRGWRRAASSAPRSRGQGLVEFALLVPILLLILLIAVDFGRLFFTYIEVNNAAREGAAYGAGDATGTTTITARALSETNAQKQRGEGGVSSLPSSVTVKCAGPLPLANPISCADAAGGTGPGNTITVNVSEKFSFLTPLINGFFNNDFTMNASATAAVLGFVPSSAVVPGTCASGPTLATFTVTTVTPGSGRTVNVDATSSRPDSGMCAISGFNWSWGDGSDPFLQEGVQFTHTFASDGIYTISLEVTNQAGTLIGTQTVTVGTPTPTPTPTGTPTPTPTPTPIPTPTPTPTLCDFLPDFTYVIASGNKVTFNGSYTGGLVPASWAWTYGDGDTATGQNPTQHHYTGGSGPYTVRLTITNGSCSKNTSQSVSP